MQTVYIIKLGEKTLSIPLRIRAAMRGSHKPPSSSPFNSFADSSTILSRVVAPLPHLSIPLRIRVMEYATYDVPTVLIFQFLCGFELFRSTCRGLLSRRLSIPLRIRADRVKINDDLMDIFQFLCGFERYSYGKTRQTTSTFNSFADSSG